MSVLGQMENVLKEFGWPFEKDVFMKTKAKGLPDKYITYNVAAEHTIQFADDTPEMEEVRFQVHMYLPYMENYTKSKNTLRRLLFQAGFTYPQVVLNITEDTTTEKGIRYRHICLETDIQTESEA